MTKIEGYEDCHMVNENNPASLSPDSPAQPISAGLDSDAQIASMRLHAAPVDAQDGGGESNGGDEPSGDATEPVHEAAVKYGLDSPSPTRTKAELVEIMIQAIHPDVGKIYRRVMQVEQGAALDALIAIGAVRVK